MYTAARPGAAPTSNNASDSHTHIARRRKNISFTSKTYKELYDKLYWSQNSCSGDCYHNQQGMYSSWQTYNRRNIYFLSLDEAKDDTSEMSTVSNRVLCSRRAVLVVHFLVSVGYFLVEKQNKSNSCGELRNSCDSFKVSTYHIYYRQLQWELVVVVRLAQRCQGSLVHLYPFKVWRIIHGNLKKSHLTR